MTKESKEILISTNEWEVVGKRVLCIYDIHQNLDWATAILDLEKGNYDHIIFGGDYFDSFWEPPKVESVQNVAQFILEVFEGKIYGPATLLLGNHDLAYLEAWRATSQFRNPRFMFNACTGYSNNKASRINRVFKWEHWKKFKLFAVANGWLLTHAGLRHNNFRPFLSPEKSLNVLEQEFNEAINHVNAFPHHLFACGAESRGQAAFGGPLWCRPNEFEDELPYPQIFGHTHAGKHCAIQLGRCFDIDGGQSTYCIIHPDSRLELKSIQREGDVWVQKPVEIKKQRTRSELEAACNRAIVALEEANGKTIVHEN
jgi:3',5'-cyclic AMP phosphodiesterase CpdA